MESGTFRITRDGQPLRRLAAQLHDHMLRYGYPLIESPIIENADLFLTKAGDKVAEKLFTFERHGEMLALRPEFTATAAHIYITQGHQETKRWQFSGPVFEDDPLDTRRQYQHFSAGAELIGTAGAAAEAEVISMAAQGIADQDIDDWQLVIGHVGLTRRLLARYKLDSRTQNFILGNRSVLQDSENGQTRLFEMLGDYFPQVKPEGTVFEDMTQRGTQDMLDVLLNTSRASVTMGGRTRHDIARRLLRKREQAAQRDQIEDAVSFLQQWMNIQGSPARAMDEIEAFATIDDAARTEFETWRHVLDLLDAYDIPKERITIQPDLARTWDYYTGIVFEIRTSDDTQLAGGGRYDELTQLLGGDEAVPAVGFAYYMDTLLDNLRTPINEQRQVVYLHVGELQEADAARWSTELRKRGISVALTYAPEQTDSAGLQLGIDHAGNVTLEEQRYAPDDIDRLVAALNGR